MTTRVNEEKLMEVRELKCGDIIKLTDGSECEFVRLKRKKFIGIIDGGSYDIPVNMFVKLLKKNSEDKFEEIKKLRAGNMFYIQANNGDAILFEFQAFNGNNIIGINPINKARTKIDKSMFAGVVENTV